MYEADECFLSSYDCQSSNHKEEVMQPVKYEVAVSAMRFLDD